MRTCIRIYISIWMFRVNPRTSTRTPACAHMCTCIHLYIHSGSAAGVDWCSEVCESVLYVCICMCICLWYVSIYVCVCVCVCKYVHTHMHAYMYVNTYMQTFVYIYTHTHTYSLTHTYAHTHMHACIQGRSDVSSEMRAWMDPTIAPMKDQRSTSPAILGGQQRGRWGKKKGKTTVTHACAHTHQIIFTRIYRWTDRQIDTRHICVRTHT
jgi:hypothetical protein